MNDRFAIAAMAAPLDDDVGGIGLDLRGGGPGTELYLDLKDLRVTARSAEREAIAGGDPTVDPLHAGLRSWNAVIDSGATLLRTVSKDLQVAAWLCEGWVRTDGFAGLAAGFTLMADLIERYWDAGLYPQEDEDGVETRLAALFGLFGRGDAAMLIQPMKLLPLSDYGDPPVALWTAEIARSQAVRHDDPELREQLVERRNEAIQAIGDGIARASPGFAAEVRAAIELALRELDRLMTAIDQRTPVGRFGSQVSQPLEDALALLREHGTPAVEASAAAAEDSAHGEDGRPVTTADGVGTQHAAPGSARTRATALSTVSEIAAFFERTEPQSLVGSGLREIVRRANLPLDKLLTELLPSSEQRTMFLLRAGIRGATDTDSDTSY